MENKDDKLWRIAVKRASFRRHLMVFFVMNAFFWVLWFLTARNSGQTPWPLWPLLGWGIGIAFNYFDAYHGDKKSMAEQEYEKLQREKGL